MKPRAAVTVLAAVVAMCLGIWGYSIAFPVAADESGWLGVLDNLYRTLRLFLIEGDPAEPVAVTWQLPVARWAAAIAFFAAVIWATFELLQGGLRRFHARRFYRNHFIVCGAGERGRALAANLLARGKRVVLIDRTPATIDLDPLTSQGVVFLHGDAKDPSILQDAGLQRAAHLVTLTTDDQSNLEILNKVLAESHREGLHCHVHLERIESRAYFEEKGRFSIEKIQKRAFLTVFNLRELAAAALFQQYPLGTGVDIIDPEASPVKLLIAGFGPVGIGILREAMATGHFCNNKPICITVLVAGANEASRRFYEIHHQVHKHVNDKGLKLWNITFTSDIEEIGPISSYHHVVAAHDDPADALSCILSLHTRYRHEDNPAVIPRFSFHAHHGGLQPREEIVPFGSISDLCSSEILINTSGEEAAREAHLRYVRSKLDLAGADDATLTRGIRENDARHDDPNDWLDWKLLPLYKRRSNVARQRHVGVKLLAFPGAQNGRNSDVATDFPGIDVLPFLGTGTVPEEIKAPAERLLRWALGAGLSLEQIVERCDHLARSEHARWNAFHVLDSWRHGERKDEDRKMHKCLLSWDNLQEQEPDTLEYDYISVYRIGSALPMPQ